MELRERYAKLLSELEDEELLRMFWDANSYDGSFSNFEAMDFEDAASYAASTYEFGRSIVYGDVTNVCEPVRYNVYMNLENVSEYQLKQEARDMIEDLAYWMEENPGAIDVPLAIEKIMPK